MRTKHAPGNAPLTLLPPLPLLSLLVMLVMSVLVAGCATHQSAGMGQDRQMPSAELDELLRRMEPRNELQDVVKQGLTALRKGDHGTAVADFQAALRLDPSNGYLHFLNALAYHMGYLSGKAKMMSLARAGYATTLRFDPSNAMASYFLGQLYFQQQEYLAAEEQFSRGLLYAPQNTALLRGLASASYYAYDLDTCQWASRQAYSLEPDHPENIRNLMFARASVGDMATADTLLLRYQNAAPVGGRDAYWDAYRTERAAERLRDWQAYYAAADASIFTTPSSDIVTYSNDLGDGDDGSGGDGTNPPQAEGKGDAVKDSAQGGAPAQQPSGGAGTDSASEQDPNLPKMANVDVVILRTEEVRSQAKGINLLDNLQASLSGVLVEFEKISGTDENSRTTTINPSLNLMDLEYNLNIFNDGMNKAEILARPSLLATEGSTSNFFSGGELHVQLSSNNYDGSMEDIPIGITLNVTPTFHGNDVVEVVVHAEHSFLAMQAEEVGFTAFSQTARTSVDATATLRFGQTLILSGLSERGNDASESGVPLLASIPGIQYFFSHKEQEETKTSILILLTPRKARYADETMTAEDLDKRLDHEMTHITSLKKTHIANTNLNAALAHLNQDSAFYRQFRTGDMVTNFKETDDSLFGAVKRILGFLYY